MHVRRALVGFGFAALSLPVLNCGTTPPPEGPDLVVCECACTTQTATGNQAGPGGCGGECDPPCSVSQTCTMSGGCQSFCSSPGPQQFITSQTTTPLHICADSSDVSGTTQECADRCDAYATGSLKTCVEGLLTALGLGNIIGDTIPNDLASKINPASAQPIADLIVQECSTYLLDTFTGTCGLETEGLAALEDILLCVWAPSLTDPLGSGAPASIRTCQLTPDLSGNPFTVQQANGCPQFAGNPKSTPVGGSPLPATEAVSASRSNLTISGPDVGAASTQPSGKASTGRIGPIVMLSQLDTNIPDTQLTVSGKGMSLTNAFLELEGPVAAALTTGSNFSIDPGKVRAFVTGSLGGRETSVEAVNTAPVTGQYDEAGGVFELVGSLPLEGVNATIDLHLSFDFINRPPTANAGPDQTVECNLPTREALVQLSADQSVDLDPGDSIANYSWTVDRQAIAQGPGASDTTARVGLGTREATLATVDTRGSTSRDTSLITVVDTTPPSIVPSSPNVSICTPQAQDVAVPMPTITDACSPTDVVSSGAVISVRGVAVPPIPVVSGHATLPSGTHVVRWTATDVSGNTATLVQTIVVSEADTAACCAAGQVTVQVSGAGNVAETDGLDYCILASGGPDVLTTGSGSDFLGGGPLADVLTSTGGNDVLVGGDQGDVLSGDGSGDLQAYGAAGDDVITAAADKATSTLYGDQGDDVITGGDGSDSIFPGPGVDTVSAGAGDDTVTLFDVCEAAPGKILNGGPGNDALVTPVPVATLESLGVVVTGFENVVVDSSKNYLADCFGM